MSTGRAGHLERTAQEPRDESLHDVVLDSVSQVNDRVRLFRLIPRSGPVSFLPGQWLDTYVPGIPKPGGFTITSPPSRPYLELAVQESPENPPAAWLWHPRDQILGSTLRVRVGGSFVFPPPGRAPAADVERVVFVAGGVGVNPLVSMMSAAAEGGFQGEVVVLYATKVDGGGLDEVLFLPRIAKLFAEGGLRGRLDVFATGSFSSLDVSTSLVPDFGRAKPQINARRLDRSDLVKAVGEQGKESTVVYVCGPQTMTDELEKFLTSSEGLGLRADQVLTEKWW